jgi:Flp pilus assembly protein TadD
VRTETETELSGASRPMAPRRPAAWKRPALLVALLACAGGAWYGLRSYKDSQSRSAYLHAARGVEQYRAGDVAGARHEFETATRLDSGNAEAWFLLGKLQREQDPKQGLPALARAAREAPNNPQIQREYGQALMEAGQPDQARAPLTSAVALEPENASGHAVLGQLYLQKVNGPADLDAAISELKTALSLTPGDIQVRFRLARAYHQADRLDEARRELLTTLSFLTEGARAHAGRMDGQSKETAVWLSVVKGCHYYLQQIDNRQGHAAEAARRLRLHTEMEKYLQDTYGVFQRLNANPQDAQAQAALAAVFRRYGLPAAGPDGKAAAERWIPGWSVRAPGS